MSDGTHTEEAFFKSYFLKTIDSLKNGSEVLLAYDGMLLLRVNNFEYPVNGSQTILYDQKDPQFALVLYLRRYPQDQWVVKIN